MLEKVVGEATLMPRARNRKEYILVCHTVRNCTAKTILLPETENLGYIVVSDTAGTKGFLYRVERKSGSAPMNSLKKAFDGALQATIFRGYGKEYQVIRPPSRM